MDLTREVDAILQRAGALGLARGHARAGRQRRDLAQRPQQVALTVGQRAVVGAVGQDHAGPAAGGGHRGADQARVAQEAHRLGRQVDGEVAGDLQDLVLAQRALGDRRVGERDVHVGEALDVDAVRADRADAPQGLVVEEDHRPVHGRQPARRLAQPAVEAGGGLAAVEREEQVGERLEGVDVDDASLGQVHTPTLTPPEPGGQHIS